MTNADEQTPTGGASVLFVVGFDSQLKWASRLWQELRARGHQCRVVAPRMRSALSSDQIASTGVETVERLDRASIVAAAAQSDVVVLGLIGPQIRGFIHDIVQAVDVHAHESGHHQPPVIVTGWVGIIIEKITAGYLDRSGADIVAVNAKHELAHFEHAAERLGIDRSNLLLTGLPILGTHAEPQQTGPVRTVVFADQPTVPDSPTDRLYVYRRLVAYARRHPERRVMLKPRHRRHGEGTIHRMHHHPEDLLAGDELPDNFSIDYRPIPQLLDEVDLLITMSSTACLEAVERGRRVALVLDLGVHERFGNQVFLDSGLLRTFDQLENDDIGHPDPAWVDSWFGGRETAPAIAIADRVEQLLATGERPSEATRASAYHRGASRVESARRGEDVTEPTALQRRRANHGSLKGLAVHVGFEWVPPGIQKPVRRWWLSR